MITKFIEFIEGINIVPRFALNPDADTDYRHGAIIRLERGVCEHVQTRMGEVLFTMGCDDPETSEEHGYPPLERKVMKVNL